jgi:hypothetical protein
MRSEAWRPAAAARNRWPREVRDPARQALRPGCEELAVRLLCNAGDGSAAPAPKTATVERREASVPRHGTQGASLGAWPAASCAGPTGVPPSTRTFLGAPPTPRFGVSEATMQTPGAENAPRERGRLFEMVNCASTQCSSSSFETHRSALGLWKRLRSSGCDAPQHEGEGAPRIVGRTKPSEHQPAAVRNRRRRNSIVSGLLFTMSGATATCRAFQRPSRIQVAARLPTSSSSPIKPANTGSTPMPRTTLASRVRSPSQSSPW